MTTTATLRLANGEVIGGVVFQSTVTSPPCSIVHDSELHFLSIVDLSRVPLYLTVGGPYTVETNNARTQAWLLDTLRANVIDSNGGGWWDTARPDSPLGVLMSVRSSHMLDPAAIMRVPSITEVLFYATSSGAGDSGPTSKSGSAVKGSLGNVSINALALSSMLLHQHAGPTPPASPGTKATHVEGFFLPPTLSLEGDVINEPPVRKRKSAADAFDEAAERRQKARRKGGQGVSAAAAPKVEPQMPKLQHRRSASNGQVALIQNRPFSRSPSITSSRPSTAAAMVGHRSSLSRVQSVSCDDGTTTVESKNKDTISRIIMAGMRLYGLSQRKSRRPQSDVSVATETGLDAKDLEGERRRDEEYKLLYHQAYKGACFAFRASISSQDLQPLSEMVQDVVDRLLSLFCNDPLVGGLASTNDKLTPGGRKAFGYV